MQDLSEQAVNKDFLRSIAEDNYQLPHNIDGFEFAQALLSNLGSPDQELRDELSYMILASGIIGAQKLTPEQLEQILVQALDADHLFYRIGEVGSDSVFTRSFSNLVIAAILYNDAHQPQLSEMKIRYTKQQLLSYARQEQDWRGYIEGKGWAHAAAHLADTLDECAQSQIMLEEDRKDILEVIHMLATLPVPFNHKEDVRLANVAYHIILGKQVEEEFLSNWIDTYAMKREQDVASWARATNGRNFLRSLYFFLYWDNVASVLSVRISNLLKQMEALYVEKSNI